MKYIIQISTNKIVHREEPHSNTTISNASTLTGIDVSDLRVVDENITEDQYCNRLNGELPWADQMAESDRTMLPRYLEDHIRDDHGGVAGNAQLQAKYDAKVALRASKPS